MDPITRPSEISPLVDDLYAKTNAICHRIRPKPGKYLGLHLRTAALSLNPLPIACQGLKGEREGAEMTAEAVGAERNEPSR